MKQDINYSISYSLTIINLKVVSKKLFGLADLTRAQTFHIHELTKVVMVNKDNDLIFAAF